MPTATKLLGDFSHVHITLRTQTGSINSRLAFFQHRHGFNFANVEYTLEDAQKVIAGK